VRATDKAQRLIGGVIVAAMLAFGLAATLEAVYMPCPWGPWLCGQGAPTKK
jgi:hypothetical protein